MKPSALFDAIVTPLRDDLLQVERVLRESMRSVVTLIPQVAEHTFDGGGKRIRPILVLLAARLCGYQGPRAVLLASCVEFLHSASLLHDDVIDGAAQRRGRPSVNARFGERQAILVGDYMYARACQMIVEDGDIEILSTYAESLRQMAEGQLLELSKSFDPDVSEAVYMEVIGSKTSSLLAAAAESGGILGGVTRPERRALWEFGWELGLAFQLVDDALDYVGKGEALGKLPLQDVSEGKITLPLLATLKRCSVGERDAIIATLKGLSQSAAAGRATPERAELELVADAVRRSKGPELTLAKAVQHAHEARTRIEPFVDCEAKRALFTLTEFVVQRDR